jgi:hypothetical protein
MRALLPAPVDLKCCCPLSLPRWPERPLPPNVLVLPPPGRAVVPVIETSLILYIRQCIRKWTNINCTAVTLFIWNRPEFNKLAERLNWTIPIFSPSFCQFIEEIKIGQFPEKNGTVSLVSLILEWTHQINCHMD